MATSDLHYMGAVEALDLFRKKKLSPVELMDAVIARAQKVQPKINSFSQTFYDEARDQAKKAEAKYAKGSRTRALEGLPLAIKDEETIKGLPASSGSLAYKDNIGEETTYIVERCFNAGGIMHARTTTPEFSCAGYTHTALWGVTRNPWNTDYTPGGSSGGTGATLAAGAATIATGSDIGGSIRIPASCSGVVGFKPPYGRNPQGHIFNLDFYCHSGPMARSVADCALLQNVMAGPHPRDIATVKPKMRLPLEYKSVKGMKIALSMDLGYCEVDKDVQKNTKAAVKKLKDAGAIVEEVDLGWTWSTLTAATNYLSHLFGNVIGETMRRHRHVMMPYAVWIGEQGAKTDSAAFIESLQIAGEMYDTLGPILEKYDALICPTNALSAVPADHDSTTEPVYINGKEVDPFLGWVMTYPFNIMSRCPVLSVPSGRDKKGVPTGLQIVGRTYDDPTVFRIGAAVEAADPWYTKASRRPKI
ncbi:MAG: amidase [Rhodospirillaceae bacterium]|nr:amidase [Rhodospirillaceae bacterium]|tara:strand:- start:433 stop:1857 length:1425 start_codon:yes stop_codon:yes gene_type:complete